MRIVINNIGVISAVGPLQWPWKHRSHSPPKPFQYSGKVNKSSSEVQSPEPQDTRTTPKAARLRPIPRVRLLILLGAMIALLAGLNAALTRLGLQAPVQSIPLGQLHGLLMVYGFLGTAICLERAVAMQSDGTKSAGWWYGSPALAVFGTIAALAQLSPTPLPVGRWLPALLWTGAMVWLALLYAKVWQRQKSFSVIIQTLGPLAGAAGILLWGSGYEAATVVPWWAAFLVLTILGERLELARVAFATSNTERRITALSLATIIALITAQFVPNWGYPLLGLVLAALILDVASHDLAKRLIHTTGLPRFMAACMLGGYGWGLLAAGIWIVKGPVYSGYGYDTVVHAWTIGFALSMVFAHAAVIIPAVARRSLPYHPVMWVPWALLQAGLLIRAIAGARDAETAWQFGGALDIVAVLTFVISTVSIIVLTSRKAKKQSA